MGSFFAGPSPSLPVQSTPTSPPPPAPVIVDEPTEPSDTENTAEARRVSLLRRSRGRLGTITTGFSGILSSANNNGDQRKTLLGE